MSSFNIDQYEITVSLDDTVVKENEEGTIKPFYPKLDASTDVNAECTALLKTKNVKSNTSKQKLKHQQLASPTKIAIIEEVGEVRCLTYKELVDGCNKTANFMSHHGVKKGDRIFMCMENCVEYVLYQLGAFCLGAIPVLVSPSHLTIGKVDILNCTAAIVDFENYGHVLRTTHNVMKSIERVFVLADEISAISIPRHLWIIDDNNTAFIIPGSNYLHQYISHTSKTESTLDVWRASFLDRIAGIIEQYRIPVLISNSQLLKCFIKYEVHKVYNLKSLQIISNHGTVVSVSTAKRIKKMLDITLIQAYSAPEFGVSCFGVFNETENDELVNCGFPTELMKIKIANLETEREVDNNEWGQIILCGENLFSGYAGCNQNLQQFSKIWFKTGDFGMIEKNGRVHCEGRITELIQTQENKISSERIESIICEHKLVEDAVIMQKNSEIWCGILLKNENNCPSVDVIVKHLKKRDVHLTINKLALLDFIPRSENGMLIRSEIPYLLNLETREETTEDLSESYI
ncbi:unnamed protein product [Caenorhabditis sp. 36 PRJEB53466]|nr:unnamed protein product [Caenorhabditis sp. 36 PRJEB53466]